MILRPEQHLTANHSALAYGNEAEVGQGIKDSGVPREEIWITTKLDNTWHHRVTDGINSSLKDLGVDYVDLYLMHWPSSTDPNDLKKHLPDWDFIKTWYGPGLFILSLCFEVLTRWQARDAEASRDRQGSQHWCLELWHQKLGETLERPQLQDRSRCQPD